MKEAWSKSNWKADDLNNKTVWFSLPQDNAGKIGVFKVRENPEGEILVVVEVLAKETPVYRNNKKTTPFKVYRHAIPTNAVNEIKINPDQFCGDAEFCLIFPPIRPQDNELGK